jgi:hypothetical protein
MMRLGRGHLALGVAVGAMLTFDPYPLSTRIRLVPAKFDMWLSRTVYKAGNPKHDEVLQDAELRIKDEIARLKMDDNYAHSTLPCDLLTELSNLYASQNRYVEAMKVNVEQAQMIRKARAKAGDKDAELVLKALLLAVLDKQYSNTEKAVYYLGYNEVKPEEKVKILEEALTAARELEKAGMSRGLIDRTVKISSAHVKGQLAMQYIEQDTSYCEIGVVRLLLEESLQDYDSAFGILPYLPRIVVRQALLQLVDSKRQQELTWACVEELCRLKDVPRHFNHIIDLYLTIIRLDRELKDTVDEQKAFRKLKDFISSYAPQSWEAIQELINEE